MGRVIKKNNYSDVKKVKKTNPKGSKIMSNGKRVTRDMRIKFLDMHNKLKNMCNDRGDCGL